MAPGSGLQLPRCVLIRATTERFRAEARIGWRAAPPSVVNSECVTELIEFFLEVIAGRVNVFRFGDEANVFVAVDVVVGECPFVFAVVLPVHKQKLVFPRVAVN